MANPFEDLVKRGNYRGRPELEAVDRKLAQEYRVENTQGQLQRDPFWKWISGIAVLIVVAFVCYDQLLRARERAAVKMMQDATKQSREMIEEAFKPLKISR